MKGGKRAGAGRPVGSVNRMTMKAREEAGKAGLLPHEFLAAIVRGEGVGGRPPTFAERLDAAKAAAPYFAARLASTKIEAIGNALKLPTSTDPREHSDGQIIAVLLQSLATDAEAWELLCRERAFADAVLAQVRRLNGNQSIEELGLARIAD